MLPLGIPALVDRVQIPASAMPVARLLHFHDVAEIVIFGEVSGSFLCDGERYALSPGMAIFAPSMRYHDFELDDGAKDWTLIQIDPYIVDRLDLQHATAIPRRPFAVQLSPPDRERMAFLCKWLADVAERDPTDPLIEQLISVILIALCQLPHAQGDIEALQPTHLDKFQPVIERLRQAPGTAVSLRDAASMCHLSPAYFSRRFAQTFGCGLADYIVSYRLHLAARLVATTSESFAQIGYTLGFSSPSHFSARFRQRFGMTPRTYRISTRR